MRKQGIITLVVPSVKNLSQLAGLMANSSSIDSSILADLFSRSVIENTSVPMPLTDAVHNMKVLEAIVQSSQSNQWENIK